MQAKYLRFGSVLGVLAVSVLAALVLAADYHAGKSPLDLASQPAFAFEWPERIDAAVDA